MKNRYFIKNSQRDSIEIEDIMLDLSKEDMEKIEDAFDAGSIKMIWKIYIIALFVLLAQAVNLQIIKGSEYAEISMRNYTRVMAVKAPRGIIYDRNMDQIVFNVPTFELVVIPVDFLNEKGKIEENLEILSLSANVGKEELRSKIEKNKDTYQSISILENIEKKDALILEEKVKNISGVSLENNAIRNYVDGKYYSHIIGYSGKINEKELKQNQGYLLNDTIGKNGLELYYEKQLRGTYGQQKIEVDSFGREIKLINKGEPASGKNMVLNIDAGLQKKSYDELEKFIKKAKVDSGAVVAINPKTGAVLSLVSYPSYDANLFARGITTDEYGKLRDDNALPLFNRAVSGEYPPGSTFKPLMGAAALQENIISPTRTIDDRGVIYAGSTPFVGWAVLGPVDLVTAISMSSNIYFYEVGGGYGDIKGLGIERIKKYANLFGLGDVLGIDMPGEKQGLIPDEDWKKRVKDEKWYIGDTYHASIGQGDVLTTPLQIASYISVIANGGKLFQPQVVDKIIKSDDNSVEDIKPKLIRENFIDLKNIEWIQKGMRENVASGSGRELAGLAVHAAGKTGTAQYYGNRKTHAWFTAYAPYENPEIVLAIIVEGGGEGHTTAVPAAKEILKWYFEKSNDES